MSAAQDRIEEQARAQEHKQVADTYPCSPRDLAYLLLAGPGLRSRQRARDQQADQAGIELKRQLLLRLAALDPEPEAFEDALHTMIREHGPPYGPTRSICLNIRNDWEAACSSPEFLAWLINEAVRDDRAEKKRKRRAD